MDFWYGIFSRILDMSVTGCIAILAVLAVRALIRKAPKKYSYLLWGIVLFRLLCPVSLPSGLSVLNLTGIAAGGNGNYGSGQSVPEASLGMIAQMGAGNEKLSAQTGMAGKREIVAKIGADKQKDVLVQLRIGEEEQGNVSVQPMAGEKESGKEVLQHTAGVEGNGKEVLQHTAGAEGNGKEVLQHTAGAEENEKESVQSGTVAEGNGKEPMQPMAEEEGSKTIQSGAGEQGTEPAFPAGGAENFLSLLVWQGRAGIAALGIPLPIAFAIWLAGAGGMACSGLVSGLLLRRKAACSMQLWGNVYLADYIATPFVMGLVHPRIYLPSGLGEQEQGYIILHEQHHISRRDYLVKILAFFALCLHWFNPLAWLSFHLAVKDMEMSCDEAVIQNMGDGIRAEYAESLLHFTVGKKKMAGMPLAFGEGDAKSRIKNIMQHKRPAAGIAGGIACLIGVACLATNPAHEEPGQIHADMGNRGLFAAISGKYGGAAGSENRDGNGQSAIFGEKEADWQLVAFQDKEKIEEEETSVKGDIQDAIIEQNGSFYSGEYEYDVACCSFVNLKIESYAPAGRDAQKITYYGWAYYREYNFTEHGIEEAGGSHMPVALTFTVDGEEYTLEEYWEPGEGSDFVKDVRGKFPADIVEDGLDSQKFVVHQAQDCYAQAVAYGRLNTDAIVEQLLEAVCFDAPSEASDPQAYIDTHQAEYWELIYYGDNTVRYFLKRFQQGESASYRENVDGGGQGARNTDGETGLRGHIMAQACEEILGLEKILPVSAGTASTGQEWYRSLKANRGDIVEYYEKMEAENPYTELGIPVMLPQNRSWIQNIVRKESDENCLQIQYYDSVLEGQCMLWAVKDGEASLSDRINESQKEKWGQHGETSFAELVDGESQKETWTGTTKSGQGVEVKVHNTEKWVLATWNYKNYAFAILGENGSHPSMIDSVPKVALGIIMELE